MSKNGQTKLCSLGLVNLQGHSCTIGNMHVPRTSENQNRQFHEIHQSSPISTFEYYSVAQKHIWQSYSSVNQRFVAYP